MPSQLFGEGGRKPRAVLKCMCFGSFRLAVKVWGKGSEPKENLEKNGDRELALKNRERERDNLKRVPWEDSGTWLGTSSVTF